MRLWSSWADADAHFYTTSSIVPMCSFCVFYMAV